jgi:hypothetical protein
MPDADSTTLPVVIGSIDRKYDFIKFKDVGLRIRMEYEMKECIQRLVLPFPLDFPF